MSNNPGGSQNQQVFQQWLHSNMQSSSNVDPQQLSQAATNWVQNSANPEQVQEATTHVLSSLPTQERAGFIQEVLGAFQQNGVSPAAAGVHTTNPNNMSAADAGKLLGYAQQQQPNILNQLLGQGGAMNNPIVQMVVSGLISYAVQRFMSNMGSGQGFNIPGLMGQGGAAGLTGNQGGYNNTNTGNPLGGLIGEFLGGEQQTGQNYPAQNTQPNQGYTNQPNQGYTSPAPSQTGQSGGLDLNSIIKMFTGQ